MSLDRLSDGYEPNFDIDYEVGRQGELFVTDLLGAMGSERIEVKTDAMAAKTGNVYIEVECRGRPSGIQTTAAEFWAFVLPGDLVVITRTVTVRELATRAVLGGRIGRCDRGSHPTRGALIPQRWLVTYLQGCT
jgi:hypothetical protein